MYTKPCEKIIEDFPTVIGPKGLIGPRGPIDSLLYCSIEKRYPSIEAMNAGHDTDGVPITTCVVIDTGDDNDPDTGKTYLKEKDKYVFFGRLDLSLLRRNNREFDKK